MRTARNTEIEGMAVERLLRRHRSKQERQRIAEESLQPGVSVAVVARRHGINANQVFLWRKLLREGRLAVKPIPAQLMPVHIAEVIGDRSGAIHQQTGVIQIELGRVRVRIEGAADPATLRTILEQLGR
jgi:transposase